MLISFFLPNTIIIPLICEISFMFFLYALFKTNPHFYSPTGGTMADRENILTDKRWADTKQSIQRFNNY